MMWLTQLIDQAERRRLPLPLLVAAAAALLTGACSDVTVPRDCGSSSFTVNVAPEQPTRPRYSWNAGPASQLRVSRLSDPIFAAWRIASDDPTGFASPVDHGAVPAGASFVDGDEPTLQAGIRYCVTVRLVDGQEGSSDFRL